MKCSNGNRWRPMAAIGKRTTRRQASEKPDCMWITLSPSSAPTIRLMCRLIAPSIPIGGASTVAYIALPGPLIPGWAILRVWSLKRKLLINPMPFRKEFDKPNYQCEPIVIGANTDAYQPAEKKLGLLFMDGH